VTANRLTTVEKGVLDARSLAQRRRIVHSSSVTLVEQERDCSRRALSRRQCKDEARRGQSILGMSDMMLPLWIQRARGPLGLVAYEVERPLWLPEASTLSSLGGSERDGGRTNGMMRWFAAMAWVWCSRCVKGVASRAIGTIAGMTAGAVLVGCGTVLEPFEYAPDGGHPTPGSRMRATPRTSHRIRGRRATSARMTDAVAPVRVAPREVATAATPGQGELAVLEETQAPVDRRALAEGRAPAGLRAPEDRQVATAEAPELPSRCKGTSAPSA
jgi:hypothetical protein